MNLEVISRNPQGPAKNTPLLFVHGAWHGAWCWQEYFLDWFAAQGFASYALSLRGHGNSGGAPQLRWASLNDYVADVASVAAGLEAQPVVIGHSMGGMVVQKYLARHKAPAGVLLASAPPGGVLATTLRIARSQPWSFLKANLTLSLYPLMSTPEKVAEALYSQRLTKADIERYAAQVGDESYRAFLDMLGLGLPRPAEVTAPMLVLAAEKDAIFTVEQEMATARAYGTTAEVFPDMGHNMMLEPDWEKPAQRITQFLDEQGIG
ncbi:MAG: alpha/beta hydrolase [Nevskiales bacterium]